MWLAPQRGPPGECASPLRMTRTRWAAVLAGYAALSLLAGFFLKAQVAPCFGSVPTGEISGACVAAWQAQRPLWDTMFDTPLGAVFMFVVLAAGTWVAVTLTSRGPNQSRHRLSGPANGPATPGSV
jgi:hypothetical protein